MASEWDATLTMFPAILMAVSAVIAAVYSAHMLRQTPTAKSDPLSALFERQTLESSVRETALLYPNRPRRAQFGGAILRGRLDHMSRVQQIWGRATHANAAREAASVIRASIRETDQFQQIEGDGFVILVPGVNEQHATKIAERLRRSLAHTKVEGMGPDMRVTASFGVAGRHSGETNASLRSRADSALATARNAGEDHIVAARDIEEVLLLPAPSASDSTVEPLPNNQSASIDHAKQIKAA